jgi:hypothetical protein
MNAEANTREKVKELYDLGERMLIEVLKKYD